MRIKEIKIRGFKRFTDLQITNIPDTAKLVILAGPNGCGKSSLFDAVNLWFRLFSFGSSIWDEKYHKKQSSGDILGWNETAQVFMHDPQPSSAEEKKKAVYMRSAYRNDPEFQLNNLTTVSLAVDEARFTRLIENDQAVNLNYKRLVSKGFEQIFETADDNLTAGEFRSGLIGDIKESMERLFPGLSLNSLGNPLTAGTFKFDKGESKGFEYKNLSGGEKGAFDLILDLLVKQKEFDNTAFFIDEPEAHLSPSLQGPLMEELYLAVGEKSQLWLATHSLGMMRKAREIEHDNPGTVVFLDFDGLDFDTPTVICPSQTDRPFWKRAMQVAFDDMAGFVSPETVVICEGGPVSNGMGFDAACYNAIFNGEFPQALFIGAGNANDVVADPRGLVRLLDALAPAVTIRRVIDLDDRHSEEIEDLTRQGVRVLSLRNIESYLLDDSVIDIVCDHLDDATRAQQINLDKVAALQENHRKGGHPDDYKKIAGSVYVACKRAFPDKKLGNDTRAFMKGICAPLLPKAATIYARLKTDIFG